MNIYDLWKKLYNLYKRESAGSQNYWLKQLVDLKMKDEVSMSSHLNEFNSVFDELSGQGIQLNDSL